jgi:hypothetical protein
VGPAENIVCWLRLPSGEAQASPATLLRLAQIHGKGLSHRFAIEAQKTSASNGPWGGCLLACCQFCFSFRGTVMFSMKTNNSCLEKYYSIRSFLIDPDLVERLEGVVSPLTNCGTLDHQLVKLVNNIM